MNSPTTLSPTTLGAALRRAASEGAGQGLRFVDKREVETPLGWGDIYVRAQQLAGGLRDRGVAPGDRVAIILPTCPAFFDAFFGAILAGAVPVPLYPPVRLGRLDEYHARTTAMLHAAGARMLLTDDRVWRILGETVRRTQIVCLTTPEVHGEPLHVEGAPSDLAMVQFSSGTTVDPKPVALSHANVLANVAAILKFVIDQDDHRSRAGVSWLPLYHDMGLIGCVFPAMVQPGSLTLIPPELFIARPALWLRALGRSGAVVSPAPNFAYALCVDRIKDDEMQGVDLSNWRLALNGAEPVSPATLHRFVARFARWGLRPEALTPVYGLAEASLAVTFSDPNTPFRTVRFDRATLGTGVVRVANTGSDPGTESGVAGTEDSDAGVELVSVGAPLPGVEVQAPTDTIGPVRVRGPSVMVGYLNQPKRTAQTLVDGWLDTGDLGFLHEGELFVTGRSKDLLILRGRNHAPHEVEQAVDNVDGVRVGCAAAVSFLPEGGDHERLLLFVEAKDPAPGLEQRCAAAVLNSTHLAVDEVILLEPGTLPRTSSGKIRRAEALRLYQLGELRPPRAVTPMLVAGALLRGTLGHWSKRG